MARRIGFGVGLGTLWLGPLAENLLIIRSQIRQGCPQLVHEMAVGLPRVAIRPGGQVAYHRIRRSGLERVS